MEQLQNENQIKHGTLDMAFSSSEIVFSSEDEAAAEVADLFEHL